MKLMALSKITIDEQRVSIVILNYLIEIEF